MKTTAEVIVSLIILVVLGVFLTPNHLLMPNTINAMLLLSLVIAFLVFIGFIWRERSEDERDLVHIYKSGRISFFVGSSILVLGIIVQALQHDIDIWLLLGLFAMVLTKIISRTFHHFQN